jgi:hypothetical protein
VNKQTGWTTAAVALLCIGASTVVAQEVDMAGSETDWAFYVVDDPRECFIVSKPTEWRAERDGQAVTVRRGEIRFYVTMIPGSGVDSEPSFLAGYPLATDQAVEVRVGTAAFQMYPNPDINPEFAWTRPEDDGGLITALRGGAQAVVTGVSARGTTTIDTFSLMGFTAAITEAESLCN